jgi:putative ABC transport system permease protein
VSPVFRALVWGHIGANKLRSAVTVLAVALGVAIALAVDLANTTAVASFASSVNVISNHINLQVLGVGRGFDDRTLLRVQTVAGVISANPAIEDALTIGTRHGERFSGEILRVLGLDLLRPVPGSDGSMTTPGDVAAPDPWLLVNGHGAFISARVAAKYHWHVGSTIAALAGDRSVRLVVAAVLPASVAGIDSSVVFVDIATAQELFDKLGRLDRIDLIIDPARLASAAAAVRGVLPPGVRAIEPKVRTGEITRMLRSFQLNLAALSYIALLVGMYLIYNTVAISVVQRRPEIGTLRALGVKRGQILLTFLAEGALFGVVGSLAGLAIGCGLATFSVSAVSKTVNTLYVASHADRVIYDPGVLLQAFLIGIGAAIVAALVPALEAAATPPAIAMRAHGFERRLPHFAQRTAVFGLGLLLVGYACTFAPPVGDVPAFGYLAGLLFIFAGSLFAPLAIAGLSRLARALLASRSAAGEIAAANLGSSPVRNSVAVASLMIAIAMTVAVAILIGSFRTTVIAWANDTLKADLFVRPMGLGDASSEATFSPSVAARIARVPGVASIDVLRELNVPFRGRITSIAATNLARFSGRSKVRFIGAVDQGVLARTLPGSMNVLISEPFATKFALAAGDRFALDTPAGMATFTVAAVYNDYSSEGGVVLIDLPVFQRLYRDTALNSIAVYARPRADLVALRDTIVRSVLPLRVDTETTRELRTLVITIFDRTFAITYGLYVISITIAVLGVVSTLFALVLERRREIGLLRYLGLRTRDVRRMVYFEAAFIGLLGGVSGVIVGVMLALLLIYVINRQAFGWLIELHMPYDFLGEAVVLVVIAALVAGVYPAGVAARIRTSEAVRAE